MQKLLTFSVAAYNVENYLDKLLGTILCVPNHEKMIEVLVVNDGSKDKTAQIAAQYEQKYPETVRLIDKENGGHGSTINRGIKEAKGKYFKAIDGDDWVDSEALEKLLDSLTQIDSDLILMDYKTCYEGGDDVLEKTAELEPLKTIEFDRIVSQIKYMRYHAVIYRTQMLQENKIHLDEHCFYVDSEFMLFPIPFIQTITYVPYALYCYRIGCGEQSVSVAGRRKHIADGERVELSLLKFYHKLPETLSEGRRAYIQNGIAAHGTFHINSLLMCKRSREMKQKIVTLDKRVKKESIQIYNNMNRMSHNVRLLRNTHYSLYWPLLIYKAFREKNKK